MQFNMATSSASSNSAQARTARPRSSPAMSRAAAASPEPRLPQNHENGPSFARESTASATTTILANIVVSVAIILVNKHVLSTFPYPVFLTAIHQLTCFVATRLLSLLTFLPVMASSQSPPPPPWTDALLAGSSNVLGLSLMNVSLLANSVLVHQTAKLTGVPAVALVQWLLFGAKPPNRRASLALAMILAGVAIVTSPSQAATAYPHGNHHEQKQQHWGGLVIAAGAVLTTAFAQAALQHMPSFRNVSGLHSVYIMSPYSTLAAFALSWIIEGRELFALSTMDRFPWTLLAVSSALAIGANVLGNALIRTTSAITYNVVGHLKTVLIVAGGMVMDQQLALQGGAGGPGWDKAAGIVVTMMGVMWYSTAQHHQ